MASLAIWAVGVTRSTGRLPGGLRVTLGLRPSLKVLSEAIMPPGPTPGSRNAVRRRSSMPCGMARRYGRVCSECRDASGWAPGGRKPTRR